MTRRELGSGMGEWLEKPDRRKFERELEERNRR